MFAAAPTDPTVDVLTAASLVVGGTATSSPPEAPAPKHSSGGFVSTSTAHVDISSLTPGDYVVCCRRQAVVHSSASALERLRARKFVSAKSEQETPLPTSEIATRILRVLRVGDMSIECERFGGERVVFREPLDQVGATKDEYIRVAGALEVGWFKAWGDALVGQKRGRPVRANFCKNLIVRVAKEGDSNVGKKFKVVEVNYRDSRVTLFPVDEGGEGGALVTVSTVDIDTVVPRAGDRGMAILGDRVGEIFVVVKRERDPTTGEFVALARDADGSELRFKAGEICLLA